MELLSNPRDGFFNILISKKKEKSRQILGTVIFLMATRLFLIDDKPNACKREVFQSYALEIIRMQVFTSLAMKTPPPE